MSTSETQKRAIKKYNQSSKGKAAKKRYGQSEKGRAVQKRYKQTEKGKITRLRWCYNIDTKEYNSLLAQQNGRCEICEKEFDKTYTRDTHVDHDHVTNKVRGILCKKCNLMLGLADESINTLANAIKYLEKNQ